MDAQDFVEAVRSFVMDAAVIDTVSLLQNPPEESAGRIRRKNPPEESAGRIRRKTPCVA
jgi:hypothetical protein